MSVEKKELNVLVGYRLQIARENGGYTQEEFAETLDVTVEHTGRWNLECMACKGKICCCYTKSTK